jgi:hypothetical protein
LYLGISAIFLDAMGATARHIVTFRRDEDDLFWESRLLRFLELSGEGRYVEGGVDVDQAHSERMDEWIVCDPEEEGARWCPDV